MTVTGKIVPGKIELALKTHQSGADGPDELADLPGLARSQCRSQRRQHLFGVRDHQRDGEPAGRGRGVGASCRGGYGEPDQLPAFGEPPHDEPERIDELIAEVGRGIVERPHDGCQILARKGFNMFRQLCGDGGERPADRQHGGDLAQIGHRTRLAHVAGQPVAEATPGLLGSERIADARQGKRVERLGMCGGRRVVACAECTIDGVRVGFRFLRQQLAADPDPDRAERSARDPPAHHGGRRVVDDEGRDRIEEPARRAADALRPDRRVADDLPQLGEDEVGVGHMLAGQDGAFHIRQELGLPVGAETEQVLAQMFASASRHQHRSPSVPPSRTRRGCRLRGPLVSVNG